MLPRRWFPSLSEWSLSQSHIVEVWLARWDHSCAGWRWPGSNGRHGVHSGKHILCSMVLLSRFVQSGLRMGRIPHDVSEDWAGVLELAVRTTLVPWDCKWCPIWIHFLRIPVLLYFHYPWIFCLVPELWRWPWAWQTLGIVLLSVASAGTVSYVKAKVKPCKLRQLELLNDFLRYQSR